MRDDSGDLVKSGGNKRGNKSGYSGGVLLDTNSGVTYAVTSGLCNLVTLSRRTDVKEQ